MKRFILFIFFSSWVFACFCSNHRYSDAYMMNKYKFCSIIRNIERKLPRTFVKATELESIAEYIKEASTVITEWD